MKRLLFLLGLITYSPAEAAIVHVGSQGAIGVAGATTASITRAAGSTSNLYTVMCGCADAAATLTVSNTTTAFTWTRIVGPVHNTASSIDSSWAVPSTVASQTITCTKSGAGGFIDILLDEWSGTATVSPIDVSSSTINTVTACSTTGTMSANSEALWCAANDSITNVGNLNAVAASKGADDLNQDWTEFRILSGTGAGTTVVGTWTGTAAGSDCLTAAIKPAAGGAATVICPALGGVGCVF